MDPTLATARKKKSNLQRLTPRVSLEAEIMFFPEKVVNAQTGLSADHLIVAGLLQEAFAIHSETWPIDPGLIRDLVFEIFGPVQGRWNRDFNIVHLVG